MKKRSQELADLSMTFPRGEQRFTPGNFNPLSPVPTGPAATLDYNPYSKEERENTKIITPLSLYSPKAEDPARFKRGSAPLYQSSKFQKGELGEYETADRLSMLKPDEDVFPPQKRQRPPGEYASNLFVGALHGMGGGMLDLASLPNRFGSLIGVGPLKNNILRKAPSREDLGDMSEKAFKDYGRFLPLPEGAKTALGEGPQVPGAEEVGTVASFAPYSVMGKAAKYMPVLEKLRNKLMSADTLLP